MYWPLRMCIQKILDLGLEVFIIGTSITRKRELSVAAAPWNCRAQRAGAGRVAGAASRAHEDLRAGFSRGQSPGSVGS